MAIASCSSNRPVVEPAGDAIHVGNGGGFAGVETIYKIYLSGEVETGGKLIGKINDRDILQLLENRRILQIDQINWNAPGNIYQLLEFHLNGNSQRIVWDPNDNQHAASLDLYYSHLMHLINQIDR
ncbi:MAG: hypothetical protein IT266_03960 [Saprospiraceae bacterium]|nr:hypothetical protein [Saprospiraceae bacterium]